MDNETACLVSLLKKMTRGNTFYEIPKAEPDTLTVPVSAHISIMLGLTHLPSFGFRGCSCASSLSCPVKNLWPFKLNIFREIVVSPLIPRTPKTQFAIISTRDQVIG